MPRARKTKVEGGGPSRSAGGRPRKALAAPPPDEAAEEPGAAASMPDAPAAEPPPSAEAAPSPPSPEPPYFVVPKLRLNAPPPRPQPPVVLKREDAMRRALITRECSNDACDCAAAGHPPPLLGEAGVEHSFLCQLHWCYAREIGCCDLDFRRGSDGREHAANGWCFCLEGAFSRPECPLIPHERPRIITTEADGTEWPYVPIVAHGGKRRIKMCLDAGGCHCNTPGTYVPMCPFRMNAATRRRRGDEVARMRGHSMWHDRERLGCPSLPSPPVSPGWKRFRHDPD